MNGECIPKQKICDGVYDCKDGSDEASCSKLTGCEPNEFQCNNRKCVLKTWRCGKLIRNMIVFIISISVTNFGDDLVFILI